MFHTFNDSWIIDISTQEYHGSLSHLGSLQPVLTDLDWLFGPTISQLEKRELGKSVV